MERKVTPAEGCPEKFVFCLDRDGGLDLEHNVTALRRWNAEAWSRCSVRPDGGTPTDGGL